MSDEHLKRGKCPFSKIKDCSECRLMRSGWRFSPPEENKEPVLVKQCVFHLLADCMENQIMRTLGLQTEMNMLRGNIDKAMVLALTMGQAQKAIDHEVDHRAAQKVIEDKKEVVEVIEVVEAKEDEVEDAEA